VTQTFDSLIVGGGIAGLATALHLARAGSRVALVDREAAPGFHASGHNAAIARQLTGRAEHTAMTTEGRDRLKQAGLLCAEGGLLLGAGIGALDPLEAEASSFGLPVERGLGSTLPGLAAAEHLRVPSDGIIDIDALLVHCSRGAREAGARITYGCEVLDVRPDAAGFDVQTTAGTVRASTLVNAAGAWAGPLGRLAGGVDIAFRPLRRHLLWSAGSYPASAPYAWWVDRPLYMRPESGGVLLCPCDESEVVPPRRGTQPDVEPSVLDALGESLADLAPHLVAHPVNRLWSGIRTFAPDRRFVIGWDTQNPRLYWVAGLGGHGMTAGLAVGRRAAADLLTHK
jgi:glycine/D-amino acid oxidase-like deaminating enzyme